MDPKEEGCRRIQDAQNRLTPEKIAEDQLQYYKSIRDPKQLEVVPVDILRIFYLQTLADLEEFKKEHSIMKRFIYTNGLWNRFLNYDGFIDHLRDVKKEV